MLNGFKVPPNFAPPNFLSNINELTHGYNAQGAK